MESHDYSICKTVLLFLLLIMFFMPTQYAIGNSNPIANNDFYNIDEDDTLSNNVLANDSDPDDDALSASLISDVIHGTLDLNGDGSFTYEPNLNYNGTDGFTYQVDDLNGGTDTATVTIIVNPLNDQPDADDYSFDVDEDTFLTGNVLADDRDVDGDTLTASVVNDVSNGSLTLKNNGSFTYTPNQDYNGDDNFTYKVDDGQGEPNSTNTATVSITVDPVNDDPIAGADAFEVIEGETLNGNVLTNDSDVDGDTLTASVVNGVSHGSLNLNGNGSFTYTHNGTDSDQDSFTYQVSDGQGGTDTAKVSITIISVNHAPNAVADTFDVNEDESRTDNVLANDSDVDGDTLTASLVSSVSNGNLTLNGNGSFTYTPNPDYNGSDTFTYEANDGRDEPNSTDTATVTITVNPVNDDPIAVDDNTFEVNEDESLTDNVLTNDFDVDGDTLTASLVNGVSHGSLNLNDNGSFTYTPNENYSGTDSFTYQVSDGQGGTDTATVSITVNPVNDQPNAVNDNTFEVNEGESLTGNVLANDSDPDGDTLTASLVSDVSNGNLTLKEDGSFTYEPNENYSGIDTFTYEANDGQGQPNSTDTAMVTITVKQVNKSPVAVADTFDVNEDTSLNGDVLTNDSDPDGDTLTANLISSASHGTLTLDSNGSFTYKPNPDYNGSDTFTYEANDGQGQPNSTDTATVTITINPKNDQPIANDDNFTIDEDTSLNGTVLTNDTDVDGDTLTASLISDVSNGSLTLNSNGSFTYTPNQDYNGTDTFTYEANDGQGQPNYYRLPPEPCFREQ